MLNPLSIQNLQTSAGKSLSAAELMRALPLNTPAPISIRQSSADTTRPNQFTLQVQLGSQLYQLKSDQSLPPGSTATLTRTTAGQLLLNSQQSTPQAQTSVPVAPQNPSLANNAAPPSIATLATRISAELNRLLPVNQPVVGSVAVAIKVAPGEGNIIATINGKPLPLTLNQSLPFEGKALLTRTADNQVLIQPFTPSSQNQSVSQTINAALRYVLPAQQPIADSLIKLQQLNNKTGGTKSPINSMLSSLLNLFGVNSASAAEAQTGVRQNLINGGLFSERNLTDPQRQLANNDMKYQLNQLLKQADKLPESARQQLHELVKNLLNRVTANQLESLHNTRSNSDGTTERYFALDLPVKNGDLLDNIQLKISEHRNQQDEDQWQQRWRIRLHFDWQTQGSIDVELVLEDEHQITAHFWCSQSQTAQDLKQKLPEFNHQLQQQGFTIQSTHCSEGTAPKAINNVEQLIDITT
ncbi:flagellar hook-length control protein FliK [Amphritea sp. 1_MG-2023]|uniref:flagellar hook-length control protein FliK n=1 Tax=Amphritea sp. 1_MG-2023 TaxID=3062670 RepID=UPI0026E367AC|nr:flagellar hook-length control protein FliK [Amphritea sp. 1_MG-2023]MDO6564021.1 flagellar hook-length control protein FliK [Amphritea sp. 1_MG-2023]